MASSLQRKKPVTLKIFSCLRCRLR